MGTKWRMIKFFIKYQFKGISIEGRKQFFSPDFWRYFYLTLILYIFLVGNKNLLILVIIALIIIEVWDLWRDDEWRAKWNQKL